jgi:pimeloyl-ACP methyl ester carboxylesterase
MKNLELWLKIVALKTSASESVQKYPALVLIHGFGANSDHWRKNLPFLAKSHRVYAIDLLGYGYSDKPNPLDFPVNSLYTFETWAKQINEFCLDVVKDRAFSFYMQLYWRCGWPSSCCYGEEYL